MQAASKSIPREPSFKDWCRHKAAQIGAVLTRLHRAPTDAFAIITYHRIAPRIAGIPAPTINVAPDRFRTQIAGLQQRGYVIRSLAEMVRLKRLGLPIPPRTVVLTFDDGFASVYRHAWPILQELQAPATLFLCTAFLDSDAPFPFDPWAKAYRDRVPAESWRPLRSEECREMLAGGLIEFGAHTHTHQDFRSRPEDLADDLHACQRILRDKFRAIELGFAFPYGYYDEGLMDVVRDAKLTCALTVDSWLVTRDADPFGWGRFTAHAWDTPGTLAAKCDGWYSRLLGGYHACMDTGRRVAGRSPRKISRPTAIRPSNKTASDCLR
jgi:peptidoglycan/xylan/chitin deacetylase (PgdA/CDA1 family)